MKEKIVAALKTKYKNLGFGDKAFDGVADYLSKTVTEESAIETAISGVETLLKSFQGDIDKRVADAVAKVKTEKAQEQGADPGATEPKKTAQPVNDEPPAWAKTLIEANQKLAEKVAAIEGDKVVTTRKQKLDAILEKLPETLRKPYQRITLKDMTDEEFETLTGEIQTEVDALVTETNAKGAVFTPPKAGGKSTSGKEPSKEEAEAVVKGIM
jgi:hypothetical protein